MAVVSDRARRSRLVDFAPAYPLSQKIKQYPSIAYRSADLMRRDVQDNIDLTNIAYLDESVDVFICSHVLEHIPDDRKAMRELRRILRPGGFGLMLVPLVIGVDETDRGAGRDLDRVSLEALRHGRSCAPIRPARLRRPLDRIEASGSISLVSSISAPRNSGATASRRIRCCTWCGAKLRQAHPRVVRSIARASTGSRRPS